MDAGAGATEPQPTMSPAFAAAVGFVIDGLEGGSRLITDQGGLTKWGVSAKAHPTLDIARLTREQAEAVYHADYWRPVRGDALPPAVALVVFDGAVQHGVRDSVRFLQQALHVDTDGVCGPITVATAKRFVPVRELVTDYLAARLAYYDHLATLSDDNARCALGWRKRLYRLAQEAGRDRWRAFTTGREIGW